MATIIENDPPQREVVQSDSSGSAAAIVLVLLVLAIIAIGAYYFMRSGYTVQAPSAPTHAVTGTVSNTDDGGSTTKSLTVKTK